eukprot:TRINITY_DN5684_c0_g1_i2.p1 TRINITY_DN5684_c0_g1~~TRINITY_DN5684_c0_g1_i2.p1  ORF type:complete len:283 (+),score=4.10 TRINITY_DN5684_c0_g1_i2:42-851(+)
MAKQVFIFVLLFLGCASQLHRPYFPSRLSECKNDSVSGEIRKRLTTGDERQLVSHTSCYPHSAIVQIVPNDGPFGICTGVLIAQNMVLTSGNCVFNRFYNQTLQTATIHPGRNGEVLPYGKISSSNVLVHPDFEFKFNEAFNFGIIKLSENVGRQSGWLVAHPHVHMNESSILEIQIQGYDGDLGIDMQFKQTCNISTIGEEENGQLQHDCKTAVGMSGSPLYIGPLTDGHYDIIAIHNGAKLINDGRINLATKIEDDVSEWIIGIIYN